MLKTILHFVLRRLAKNIIKKYHPDIIGITGSIGKTSTKEAIATVLATKFFARANYKNYNNEIGAPLTIIGEEQSPGKNIFGWLNILRRALSLLLYKKKYPEILVLEMGADKPGDILYLVKMAPCKVGVLTYISHAHTEYFKTIKKIAQEKRVIISHLNRDGFAVLNYDNEIVMQNAGATKAEIITYGLNEGADVRATDINIIVHSLSGWPSGLNFKINYRGNAVPAFLPGAVAMHLIPSALAGVAVGAIYGINLLESAQALKNLPPLPGHMRLIAGIKDTLIIDDSYNSSPEPTKSALETLARINLKEGARRFAVLGDMLELGAETENAHREIGFKTAEVGADFLITVGEAGKHTAIAAREAGLEDNKIASFAEAVTAGKFLQEKISAGDVALIKGSQGSRMEKIVKEIMAEPLEAPQLLVRQNAYWLNR